MSPGGRDKRWRGEGHRRGLQNVVPGPHHRDTAPFGLKHSLGISFYWAAEMASLHGSLPSHVTQRFRGLKPLASWGSSDHLFP